MASLANCVQGGQKTIRQGQIGHAPDTKNPAWESGVWEGQKPGLRPGAEGVTAPQRLQGGASGVPMRRRAGAKASRACIHRRGAMAASQWSGARGTVCPSWPLSSPDQATIDGPIAPCGRYGPKRLSLREA